MFIGVVEQHHGFLTTMPDIGYFITADYFFIFTYLYIVVCLTVVLFSSRFRAQGRERIAQQLCGWSRAILPVLYVLLMAGVVYFQ